MFSIRFLRCIFARWAPFVAMAASGLLLSACATMFADKDQVITLSPSQEVGNGAQAVVSTSSGTQRVQLPTTIGARSSSERVIVRLQDDRFHPAEIRVERSVRGVYWVNILNLPFFGVGFLVDYLTGAMWRSEGFVVVTTEPKS